MSLTTFIEQLKRLPGYRGQIVHLEHILAREARYGDLDVPLHPAVTAALRFKGIDRLYSHQAAAVNAARRGESVIASTSTASGKTLCYNLPVLDGIANNPRSRAIYLFPTKALAQDQLRGLDELVRGSLPDVKVATFDGDTPGYQRSQIKRSSQIILTNPDMLHLGILPNHGSWSTLFRQLKYVVVDEAHTYRGVFGSHVANVFRRLRRICRTYGSDPRFILCSATIANPKEHAEALLGLPVTGIGEDGSPHGSKDFVLWNPPLLDEAPPGKGLARRSANSEATLLFSELVREGIRNITFTKSRKLAELIYVYAREALAENSFALSERISPYRGGYLAEDRRQIEKGLFNGQLIGVTATTALELGVDIGDLEATVLTGYPGTIASTWQQAGRSGRGKGHALSFLIGLDNPLDQYLMRHPEAIFQSSPENALINPRNPRILQQHLLCAAYELPLEPIDQDLFGVELEDVAESLAQGGQMVRRGRGWYVSPSIRYPAQDVNIRSTSSRSFVIVDSSRGNVELETVEASTAFFQIHDGAIYLHQGETFLVEKLDLVSGTAYARPVDVPYYTQARDMTDLRVVGVRRSKRMGEVEVCFGEVEVTTAVLAFKKKRIYTEEIISEEPLDLPPYSFRTEALWFDIPSAGQQRIESEKLDFRGGLHAVEHAAIAMLPLFAMCDRRDIGGLSTAYHPDTGKPQVFIHDAQPEGIGIAERGYDLIRELWQTTYQTIGECPCEEGCPSCIQSAKCGNNNEPLDKMAALVILGALLESREVALP
ncbi:MAG: DEAD/DEAH box helicase [Dehalococcoidia bacterium]|nr:DEAD/DEAH box helicase [Dehalococcoidia bacterium]